jgi:hypothetical protein
VAEGVHESHPVVGQPLGSPPAGDAREGRPGHETSANEASGGGGWAEWTPARLRQRRASIPPMLGSAEDDSEDESAGEDGERARQRARDLDRQLAVMRRVFRKWCRLARVHGKNIRTCDSLAESECDVGWTRAIAPRVEGRIRMVTGSAAPGTEGQ